MSKLRIIYIVGLLILGVLVAFTIVRPMVVGEGYSEVQQEGLLQDEDEWIIQFDLINHEGSDQNYLITVLIDGQPYSEGVLLRDRGIFTYIHHIRCDKVKEGCVTIIIHKEGEETPIEKATYFLK